MEEEELLPKEDLNLLNPLTLTPSPATTGYDAFKVWAGERMNNYGEVKLDLGQLPQGDSGSSSGSTYSSKNGKTNTIADDIAAANKRADQVDSTKFAIKSSEISPRYNRTYKGLDNEELYAQTQTTGQKAYNGVAKMVGTAATTFVNGTAGLVYGINEMSKTGELSSFYNNDLANYLNNVNKGMEDTYAHYKTKRELDGSWWEPSNLFTANFLFDNVIKNLGFSLGAMGAGFAWGGAIKALGLTGRLMATGEKWAAAADTALGEATTLVDVQRLGTTTSKLEKLWQSAKVSTGTGLMKTDQFITAAFGTFGEAGIEALNNTHQFRDDMIAKYTASHGYAPDKEDLQEINDYAQQVGDWSFKLNTALLTATNYVQLPKIFASSFKGEKSIVNGIARTAEGYVEALPQKGFGKMIYKAGHIASLGFNTAEAFEEGAQFAIQTGTQNYFDRKFNNQQVDGIDDGLLYGVKEALTTDEGLLNIFTGGFAGALQSSGIVGIKKGLPTIGQTGKIGQRGWTGYGGKEGKLRTEAINSFNESKIQDKLKEISDNINASAQIQQEREVAIRQGDILEAKDLELDYAHSFIAPRVKYGAKQFIDDEITDLKERAINDFIELQASGIAFKGDTKETFLARLNNIQEHADHVEKLYAAAEIKYKGLINKDTGERAYSDEVIDKLVYAGAKIMDYDKRIPQLNESLALAGIPTQLIMDDILANDIPSKEALTEAVEKIKALSLMNEDDLIRDLSDIAEIAARRNLFIKEYKDIKRNPEKYEPVKPVKSADKKAKQSVVIKTKGGDQEIEIGEEYYLGAIASKDANDKDVFHSPLVKIVGVNEDGSLQLLDVKTNKITNVTPEQLKTYTLQKSSEVSEIDKWLLANANLTFTHRGLRDKAGKFREGIIKNYPKKGLVFIYVNEAGKKVTIPIRQEQLVPKPGSKYKQGIIAPSAEQTESFQKTLQQVFGKKVESTIDQIDERNNYLAELHEEGIKRIDEINKQLETNKQTLENKAKELAEKTNDLTYTKKGTLRKGGFTAIQNAINSINTVINNLEAQNEELAIQKEELEYTVPFYQEIIDSLEEFPEENSGLINKMKSQIKVVEDLIIVTQDTITITERLIKQAHELYDNAVKAIERFIQQIKKNNPDLPTIFIDEFQEMNEKFLGEEGARQLVENRQGFAGRIVQFQADIASFTDEVNLPKMEERTKGLVQDLQDLATGLEDLKRENNKRKEILEGFQQFVDALELRVKEEARINNDPKAKASLIQTQDKKTIQTADRESNADFEPTPKKPTHIIPVATMGIDRGKPHQTRANNFGINLHSFPNRKEIRGVYITAKNAGPYISIIDELVLSADSEIDRDQIIALVMFDTDGNLVGEDGQPIEDNFAQTAIYQVMPDATLSWKGDYEGDTSMFRKGTDTKVKEAVIAQYTKDRERILSSENFEEPHTIDASFGRPVFERDEANEIDYNARNSVQDAGLITNDQLLSGQVVSVATSVQPAEQGLVSYMNAFGKVFLRLTNGLVPLQNRKHSKQEAETIFNAIYILSENLLDPKEGINSDKSVAVLQYLKSVVYWGIPVDPAGKRKATGYNSIFFEEDEATGRLMLTISNKGNDVIFTPRELTRNRGEIIELIQTLHSNVNSAMVKNINEPYEQFVSLTETGEIETITWPNYQAYLISDKAPNENGELTEERKDEIPLTTIMRKVDPEAKVVNRTDIYFYTTDNVDDYAFAEVAKRTTGKKKKITAGKLDTEEDTEGRTTIKMVETNITKILKGFKTTFLRESMDNIDIEEGESKIVNFGGKDFKVTNKGYLSIKEAGGVKKIVKSEGYYKAENIKYAPTLAWLKGKGKMFVFEIEDIGAEQETFEEETEGAWVYDGETPNIFIDGRDKQVTFTIETGVNEQNFQEKIVILDVEDGKEAVDYVKKVMGLEDEEGDDEANLDRKHAEAVELLKEKLQADIFNNMPIEVPSKKTASTKKKGGFNPFAAGSGFNQTKQEEEVEEDEEEETPKEKKAFSKTTRKRGLTRQIVNTLLAGNEIENWNDVEAFIKKAFPNVPLYRVKNILTNTNGSVEAWGMFQDGAIYLYENAEVGTIYHEVFEAIWDTFTTARERVDILQEFKNREGQFLDRPSQTMVSYSEATPDQIREQLAEEARDYFKDGKTPPRAKNGKSFFARLLEDLLTMIKNFFSGSKALSNTEKLFENIGKGKYSTQGVITNASYSKVGITDINDIIIRDGAKLREKINDVEKSEIIQEMTFSTLAMLVNDDKSLFDATAIKSKDLYNKLYTGLQELFNDEIAIHKQWFKEGNISKAEYKAVKVKFNTLKKVVERDWESLKKRHKEYLKGYRIDFDESDTLQVRDDNKIKESDFVDATKVDHFKKANRAIKLLLSTIPAVDENEDPLVTSIGGVRLLPISKVFINLLNNISDATGPTRMMEKLRVMAENDPNYRILYKRLTKRNWDAGPADLRGLDSTHASQLVTAFYSTFKKYNSVVKNIVILETGEVSVGEAHLSNAANQLRAKYENAIVLKTKSKKGFFTYSKKEKAYVSSALKVAGLSLTTKTNMVKFLTDLGVDFTLEEVNRMEKTNPKDFAQFKENVLGIRDSLKQGSILFKINAKYANISNRLLSLGYIKARISNPEVESVFFNMSGEMTQSYIGPNTPSQLYEALSSIESLTPAGLDKDPQYNYLLTDVFAKGSRVLARMFDSNGNRKHDTKGKLDGLMQVGYVGGIDNREKGTQKPSSKLNYRDRLIQEINLNLKGWYLNLIPGDSSLEHMTNLGNEITSASLSIGMKPVFSVFKEYFISELMLSREKRDIAEIKLTPEDIADGKRQRRNTDLRFFMAILENKKGISADEKNKLHDDIVNAEGTPQQVYTAFEKEINKALENFIENDVNSMTEVLSTYNIASFTKGDTITLKNIALPENMTEQQFRREMKAMSVNYMIANIEQHKLLYSDPYQYEDELKRIKSFNSPRQLIVGGNDGINEVFAKVWNKGFNKKDIGFTDFLRTSFRTVTFKDVIGYSDLKNYGFFKETDGGGIITMQGNRHFRIREGRWNDQEENQYRYDIAFEKVVKGLPLTAQEKEFEIKRDASGNYVGKNPKVQSAYTNLKPIVSGNKEDGNSYNDVVLDKFALYPLSFRIMYELNSTSNALKLYNKMQAENIDYMVFDSGRKVGSKNSHATYNDSGSFNNAPFVNKGKDRNVINVPFEIISVQTDVPSKEEALIRRGTQVTKLITMDFMDGGIPVDFMPEEDSQSGKKFIERYNAWNALDKDEKEEASPLYKEIVNNQTLLEAIIEEGVNSLLSSLGIVKTVVNGKDSYKITDFSEAGKTLRNELLKREVNENISLALEDFLVKGIALESTPAYQQVRNVLYSIADREVISGKITGGMKVQIPATFLESTKTKLVDINGKKGYTSDTLGFYSEEVDVDGKRTKVNVCEIMVGRWFKSPLSDEALLKYLNTTKEGQKVLMGMGYRVPTQAANSIDVFRIKQFLPEEFKDSVVIPSALVAKVGSDFDIDKLSLYFKNVYTDADGNIKLIPFLGYGEEAIQKLNKLISEPSKKLLSEQIRKLKGNQNLLDTLLNITNGVADENTFDKWIPILINFFPEQVNEEGNLDATEIERIILGRIEKLGKKIEDITSGDIEDVIIAEKMSTIYKQSLQNGYIESGEKLISHPDNYDRLVKPNSADELKALSKFVAERIYGKTFNYTDVGNMLSRKFMSNLRHAFVSGKYAIGIAAVNQTNHSLNQRVLMFLDPRRKSLTSPTDQAWLGNAEIKFKEFNKVKIGGRVLATLSKIKNAAGKDISSILGQFIDGYVDISKGPWIMELGATPNVASTWMFLAKVGVPIDTITYFMNQPIIRDYLRTIENDGYSYLFMDTYVKRMMAEYGAKEGMTHHNKDFIRDHEYFEIPSKEVLKDNVGKTKLTAAEEQEQQHILVEFLKYAKMAEQMFFVTQGSNFDTANFNDPYLIFKKLKQLDKANNTIIASLDENGNAIAGVEAMLNSSFLKKLSNNIYGFRDALATILKSDQKRVRSVVERVLLPYINLSDREFLKVSQKVVADLFDWAVQNDGAKPFNTYIDKFMIDNQGILPELAAFVKSIKDNPEHPLHNNHVINIIELLPSPRANENAVNNIKIRGIDNKVYDQNNIIYGFRAIRDYLKETNDKTYKTLYRRLVIFSIVQSGLTASKISFSSVLPYEDFQPLYNDVLGNVNNIKNLDSFKTLGVFERNNWNNDDVVPAKRAQYIAAIKTYNAAMEFLPPSAKRAIRLGEVPVMMTQNTLDREAQSDFMVYSWEEDPILTAEDKKWGNTVAKKKMYMKRIGDYSFIKKGLFRKTYDGNGDPFVYRYVNKKGELREYFVYKAVNAWGDSFRAQEFYDEERESVVDNGFIKVEEVEDSKVNKFFRSDSKKTIAEKMEEAANRSRKKTAKELFSSKSDPEQKVETDWTQRTNNYLSLSKDELLEDYSQTTGLPMGNPTEVGAAPRGMSKEDLEKFNKDRWKEEDNDDTCVPF